MSIEKHEMMRVLHDEQEFAGKFINYMLERNIKIEADLVDQLFNSSEKRLHTTPARLPEPNRPLGLLVAPHPSCRW